MGEYLIEIIDEGTGSEFNADMPKAEKGQDGKCLCRDVCGCDSVCGCRDKCTACPPAKSTCTH